MQKMKIRAEIFDMDGVLLDGTAGLHKTLSSVIADRGLKKSRRMK
jgi:beta-phosphoglucomutase-like phosphatase (HAD superfamily)